MTKRKWTADEEWYLEKYYERKSTKHIAKKLNRSMESVEAKASRLGLNKYVGEYIRIAEISRCFNIEYRTVHNWINKHDFPVEKEKHGKSVMYAISVEEFWKWAETHKDIIPFHKYEKESLLPEPSWVSKEVSIRYQSYQKIKNHKKSISNKDRNYIKFLYERGKSIKEIAQELYRTTSSIEHILYNN